MLDIIFPDGRIQPKEIAGLLAAAYISYHIIRFRTCLLGFYLSVDASLEA